MTNFRFLLAWISGVLAACNAPKPRERPAEARAVESSSLPQPAASLEPASAPPEVTKDGWVDVFSYGMKASHFQRCPKSGQAGAESEPASLRLGVLVHVRAKYDELLVAARDFTLEKDGVILSTEIDPEPCGGTAPLRSRQLKSGQVATGLVVFRVPETTFVPGATLAYRATRWGGAPRAELSIPACWPSCPGDAVAERATR